MSAECSAENTPSGYKQTEVEVIPEDWEYLAIGNLIDLLTGFPFPSIGYSRSGVRLLRGSNVKRGVTDWSEEGTEFWPAITSEIRKYALRAGDIVVAMDGSLVGRSFAMLSESDLPAVLLQRVARIRSEFIEQNYLKAWICSQRFTEHCDAVKTVTAIPHISPADIKSFKIALPPTKDEQESIAEALSDTDTLIESLEQLIAKKRQIKQGAMQELLTGKKRLPGFETKRGYKQTEIGMIPEDWELMRIGAIATIEGGFAFSSKNFLYDGKYQVVKMSNLYGGSLDLERSASYLNELNDQEKHYLLHHDDILITLTGTIGKRDYGYSYKINNEKNLLLNQRVCRLIVGQEAIACYVAFQLKTPYFLDQFFNVAKGGTGNQTNVGTKDIEEIRIPAPSLLEQEAIATILSDMDSEITALEENLAKAHQIKQGMMQELLTGRVRLI